jgi:hypothetical protein
MLRWDALLEGLEAAHVSVALDHHHLQNHHRHHHGEMWVRHHQNQISFSASDLIYQEI